MSEKSIVTIVTGTRKLSQWGKGQAFLPLHASISSSVEVHVGCSTGIDELAREMADELGRAKEVHYANWDELGNYAGPERNIRMMRAAISRAKHIGAVVHCVAFPSPFSKGTWDCLKRCSVNGISANVYPVDYPKTNDDC